MSDIENKVFCGNCAKRVAPAMFCSSCGAVLVTNESVEKTAAVTEEKPALVANAESPVSSSPPMNTFAIVALVLSIFGFGFVASIIGHISLSQIKQRGEEGRGLAVSAIVVGYLTTAVVLLLAFAFAFFAPLFAQWYVASWDSSSFYRD